MILGAMFPPQSYNGYLVLNRHEAKSRLKMLMPGTQEHTKLQEALIRTAGIVEICLPTMNYKVNTSAHECALLGGFGSAGHMAIGEKVELKGLEKRNTTLIVRDSTEIEFKHIIALAGDYYGIAGQAISLPGGSDEEKIQRFINAFNTLANANHNEIKRVLAEINDECKGVANPSLPHHCYNSQMMVKKSSKIKSDVKDLLIDNSDHFSVNAKETYLIGHQLAIKVAKSAGEKHDLEGLKRAYALDAFACHFLTDLFSAGHIRNQRGELETFLISKLGFSLDNAKFLSGILTGAQHEKDGDDGLHVVNENKDSWIAYGDENFSATKNEQNKEMVIAATQKSADEIYDAYFNHDAPSPSTVAKLIPSASEYNHSPLYSVKENRLFLNRRDGSTEIDSQEDYFLKALTLAWNYLPEQYIDWVLNDKLIIKIKSFLTTNPALRVGTERDRLTAGIWHFVGLVSYNHLAVPCKSLNEKLIKMSDRVKESHDDSVQILEKLKENEHMWKKTYNEITSSISCINKIAFDCKRNILHLSERELEKYHLDLRNCFVTMSQIFEEGNVKGKNLLGCYESMLSKTSSMIQSEINVHVTIWFRQMLDYQIIAFQLYTSIKVRLKDGLEHLPFQIMDFESRLLDQINVNKDYIDDNLIFKPPAYIKMELRKCEIEKTFLARLKEVNNKKELNEEVDDE